MRPVKRLMLAILRSLPFLILGLAFLALLGSAVLFVLRQLDLMPPESLSIAAGEPGTAYYRSASAYREVLARDGIVLDVLETRGSLENAQLLSAEEQADVALVQGGVALDTGIDGLAAVHLEPLWVFAGDLPSDDPNRWEGLRVAAGVPGSGSRLLADELASVTGATRVLQRDAVEIGGADAARALLAGELDVALFVAPATAPYLQALLYSEAVGLHQLAHSEALVLRLPGARVARLPSGAIEYRRPLPPEDIDLIAFTTRLVAREDLHPALVNRLIHAAIEVHGGGGILPADRQYPASMDLGVDSDSYASQLLKDGFSPLEQFLPYWIVAQLSRVLLVLLPALLLLLPLMRVLPGLYEWVHRRRVLTHYARVHEIDSALVSKAGNSREDLLQLQDELDEIEGKLLRANLPNSYRKEAYTLLLHLSYVRTRAKSLLKDRADA